MQANINRDAKKTKAFSPSDFMPQRPRPPVPTDITALKLFIAG
jgi:hypothetical protein